MRRLPEKECRNCHKLFTPKRTKQKYCCGKCSDFDKWKTIWNNKKLKSEKTKCPNCSKNIEKFPPGSSQNNPRKFCSFECAAQYNGKSRIKPKTERKCPVCNKLFYLKYKQRGRKYCSKVCAHVAARGIDNLSPKSRAKLTRGMKRRYKNHPETRDKLSKSMSKAILDGRLKSFPQNCKTGTYFSTKMNKQMFYRSGWELLFMKYLDSNYDVINFDYEPFCIAYKFECKRNYIPGFFGWVS
jgi:endogenous inhibitor of DNA gyrase (YacG/DUF329 family)